MPIFRVKLRDGGVAGFTRAQRGSISGAFGFIWAQRGGVGGVAGFI